MTPALFPPSGGLRSCWIPTKFESNNLDKMAESDRYRALFIYTDVSFDSSSQQFWHMNRTICLFVFLPFKPEIKMKLISLSNTYF